MFRKHVPLGKVSPAGGWAARHVGGMRGFQLGSWVPPSKRLGKAVYGMGHKRTKAPAAPNSLSTGDLVVELLPTRLEFDSWLGQLGGSEQGKSSLGNVGSLSIFSSTPPPPPPRCLHLIFCYSVSHILCISNFVNQGLLLCQPTPYILSTCRLPTE